MFKASLLPPSQSGRTLTQPIKQQIIHSWGRCWKYPRSCKKNPAQITALGAPNTTAQTHCCSWDSSPGLSYQFQRAAPAPEVMDWIASSVLARPLWNPWKTPAGFINRLPVLCWFGKFFKCQKWKEYFLLLFPWKRIFLSNSSFFCATKLEAGVDENEEMLFSQVFFSVFLCEQGPVRGLKIWNELCCSVPLHQLRKSGNGSLFEQMQLLFCRAVYKRL